MIEESDDDVALRAQQIQKEWKFIKKGKYQRLNRFELSNYDMNEKNEMSMNDTEEKVFIIISRKKQLKQNLQTQKRTKAMSIKKLNNLTKLISEFIYEVSQTSSRIT